MSREIDRWFAFNPLAADFEDEPAVCCYLAKLFAYHERRNAWHGLPNLEYANEPRVFSTQRAAREAVENWRVQGSAWNIVELPAIIIAGDEDALVLSDLGTATPFWHSRSIQFDAGTLVGLGLLFEKNDRRDLHRFIASSSSLSPTRLPFTEYKSSVMGPKDVNTLHWTSKKKMSYDLTPTLELVSRINAHLQSGSRP